MRFPTRSGELCSGKPETETLNVTSEKNHEIKLENGQEVEDKL